MCEHSQTPRDKSIDLCTRGGNEKQITVRQFVEIHFTLAALIYTLTFFNKYKSILSGFEEHFSALHLKVFVILHV